MTRLSIFEEKGQTTFSGIVFRAAFLLSHFMIYFRTMTSAPDLKRIQLQFYIFILWPKICVTFLRLWKGRYALNLIFYMFPF